MFGGKEPALYWKALISGLLWDALNREYRRIGLESINDEVFKQLVLARIIEPTSKLDTIRVLEGLGLAAPSNSSIHGCLRRINGNSYRDVVSSRCFEHAVPSALTLVLYDVTTLSSKYSGKTHTESPDCPKSVVWNRR